MVARATVTVPEMVGLLAWWSVMLAAPVMLVRRWRRRGVARRAARGGLQRPSNTRARRPAAEPMSAPGAADPTTRALIAESVEPPAEANGTFVGTMSDRRSHAAAARASAGAQAIHSPRASRLSGRLASDTLEPLCRYVDFRRRLELATSELEAKLRRLPADRWRVEPYPLTGERRNTLLIIGETGVFVLSATYAPGHWDDVITVSRLAAKIQLLLPGYPGRVEGAICHPFTATNPRIWHRPDEHGDWLSAWVLGRDCVIDWLAHFGPQCGLNRTDLERFDQLAKPDWHMGAIPTPASWPPVGESCPTRLGGVARGRCADPNRSSRRSRRASRPPSRRAARRRSASARAAAAHGGLRVESLDLAGEIAGDFGQFAERAGDRAQGHAFECLAELGDDRVEALPPVNRPRPRPSAGAQLMGELHVSRARMWTMREPELVGVPQRRGLLLGGVRDRSYALSEPMVRRRFDTGFERLTPTLVGELHLFERDPRVAGHDRSPAWGLTVMMWSAICRGAGVRGNAAGASLEEADEEASWRRYAGEALDSSARSTSERRTRQVRPARTAARRPDLTHARTVAWWSFSSSLTWGTVSHGSSSGVGAVFSDIERFEDSTSVVYHLELVDSS
jgi:hypothetical protein